MKGRKGTQLYERHTQVSYKKRAESFNILLFLNMSNVYYQNPFFCAKIFIDGIKTAS